MKIDRVEVTYGELRSFPGFSHKRYDLTLGATLETGETATGVELRLRDLAMREVKRRFGDNVDQTEMDLPF